MADETQDTQAEETNEQPDAPETNAEAEKTLTQSEVNALIAKEKAKAERSARKKFEEEQAEAQRQAELSAEEKRREQAEVLEAKSREREAKANARIIRADAKAVAQTLGFRQDRISEVLAFADLGEVAVSDEGEADQDALKAALQPLIKRFPEWQAGAQAVGQAGKRDAPRGPKSTADRIEAKRASGDYEI